MSEPASIAEVVVAADPELWRAAGFDVDGDLLQVGAVALRLAGTGAGGGIVRCELAGVAADSIDGLPTTATTAPARPARAEPHPNGVVRLDHLVAFTPDLDRTVAAGRSAGLDLRRVRDEPAPAGSPRQAFFRLGEVILEIAQAPPGSPLPADAPARFFGLAFLVDAFDAAASAFADRLGEPRPAVQPGRRIATVRREAGLGLPVVLMDRDAAR